MTEKCCITGCDKPGEKVITSTKHLKRYYCYTHYKEVSIIIRSMYRSTYYPSRRRRLAKLNTNKRGGLIGWLIIVFMLAVIIILQLAIFASQPEAVIVNATR